VIAELLNRQFVIDQLAELRERLPDEPVDGVNVKGEVAAAEERERRRSSGQPGFGGDRRGGPPLDDFSFFSRDPTISLVQSALDAYFDEHPELVTADPPADDGRRGPSDQPAVTGRRLRQTRVRREEGRRLFNRFSITDIQWVRSKIAEGIRLARDRHAFNPVPAPALQVPPTFRLYLVGDWATGIERAQRVAAEMRKRLAAAPADLEQHVIHLGDVYYSGWAQEVRNRFLRYWPVQPGDAKIRSWAVNANHDMYSGGHGYYDVLLGDDRFARQQRSSLFSLTNKHWRILGLDTAWDDHGLKDPQQDWIREELRDRSRKSVLLSHHQLFSGFEKIPAGDDDLSAKIMPVLREFPATAWFWGHEHRCVAMKPTDSVTHPRCLGDGGVPVYMTHDVLDPLPASVLYEHRGSFRKGLETWALFGFAVLDFVGDRIEVDYVTEYGSRHYAETLT
jgi:hypothetical protein